jgi:hypothetical protein
MKNYRKVGFVVGLAVTLGFASTAFCAAEISKDLKDTHPSETLLAQADKATASLTGWPASSSVCYVPREYIRRINSGEYDKMGELFSDDAVYMGPDGETRHGAKEIGAFYKVILPRLQGKIAGLSFLENGDECIMELGIEPNSSGGNVDAKIWPLGTVPHPAAIDIFTINSQGKASKFLVYVRPGTNNPAAPAKKP